MIRHIILEGPDKVGKSSLINEMKILLENSGKKVKNYRNPNSPVLYKQMHNGILTPFQIAMSTMLDMASLHRYVIEHEMIDNIILQDRSALVSGQVYNVPYMEQMEFYAWRREAEFFYQNYLLNNWSKYVILTNQPYEKEENVFTNDKNVEHYARIAYSGGLLKQDFLSFSSEGNITESARKLLKELGYDT